jgi:uncharacterized protein (TIGR03086 family)
MVRDVTGRTRPASGGPMSSRPGGRLSGMCIVDLGPAARRLGELIARTSDSEMGAPTPCPAYNVGDLIEHLGVMALAFAAAARKEGGRYAEPASAGDAARLPADWRSVIPRDLGAVASAWADPAAWSGLTRIAGMDAPADMIGLSLADELVVHGWDLARATGQPWSPPAEAAEESLAFAPNMLTPDYQGEGKAFAPRVAVAADAPALDRLLGLSGRDPGWSRE